MLFMTLSWLVSASAGWAAFAPGDLVKLKRNETLVFKGEDFLPAPKGQEFTVFKYERGKNQVFVAFIQNDASVIAVTLPEDSLELVPPDSWTLLQKSVDAFREQRIDEARKLLSVVGKDGDYKALAGSLLSRMETAVTAARPALAAVGEVRSAQVSIEQKRRALGGGPEAEAQLKPLVDLQALRMSSVQKPFIDSLSKLRETPVELERLGFSSLALGFDDGLERFAIAVFGNGAGGGESVPWGTKVDRGALQAKVNRAAFSLVRCRQAMGVKRMMEASSYVKEGLDSEPGHPGLKALKAKVDESLKDAEDRYVAASSNRSGKNLQHGLMALERGLKICADYPKLLALRKEMSSALELGASPPVTPELIAAAKTSTSREQLESGRKLYVTRCVECHDLEMLDSRSSAGWKSIVQTMSRKAHLKGNEQELIVEYLAVAKEGTKGQ